MVPGELDRDLLDLRDQLCIDLGKPVATVLHWTKNIKNHSQRKHVCRTLASQEITLTYVVIDKASFGGSPGGLGQHERMYNYAMRRLLERISWFARDAERRAFITISNVKNFKYQTLRSYLAYLQTMPTSIEWGWLARMKMKTPADYELLQFADIGAGALSSAVWPDDFGAVEARYLNELASRIYRRPPGAITTYGLHVMRTPQLLIAQPWWATFPK